VRLRLQWNIVAHPDQAAVRIGRKLRSHARYYLRNQGEIDERLELPARLRAPIAPA
jgi:hypothetical protein